MTSFSLQHLVEHAQGALRRGDAALALKLARQALAQQSRHPGLNHLAGIAAHHAGDSATALRYLRKAVDLKADWPGVLTDLGQVAWAAGRGDEAETSFRQATRIHPHDAESWEGLGNVLLGRNKLGEAIDAFRQAVALAPTHPRILTNHGVALARAGRFDEARQALRDAVARSAGIPDILANLAMVEAEAGNPDAASDLARQVLATVPGHVMATIALANAEQQLGNPTEAERLVRQAVQVNPGNPELTLSLASVLLDLGRDDQADDGYRDVLRVVGDHPKALTGLARLRVAQGRFDEGRDLLVRALRVTPDWMAPRMELALLELSLGRFDDAFPHYDWRFLADHQRRSRPFTQPRWDGVRQAGRRLLLWGEQGVGDEVLWLSLLPDLLADGLEVTVECDPRLLPLVKRSFPSVMACGLSQSPAAPCLDPGLSQLPLGELFRFVPRHGPAAPYLVADPLRSREMRGRLESLAGGRKLVGVSWRSAALNLGEHKSLTLESLRAVAGDRFALVSLQYGDVAAELARAREAGLEILSLPDLDITGDLDGFASLVAAMDHVVTTSNTTVHFAGGLGVPTEVMLPKARGRHWYYGVDGNWCRWYPRVRLHRQTFQGAWDEVLRSVGAVLAAKD
ncbi:MAG: tetratricopeptide repeat protein [Magnetospirillum sp.]|nr:tetratricopeptide repeat protein [Magnetospirillum sp.]